MNRVAVAIGCFVSVTLLLSGCCGPCSNYTGGYGPYGDSVAGACDTCGPGGGVCTHTRNFLGCASGCGDVYWGEWLSDPPSCGDPCDPCGGWTGPGYCGPAAPYAGSCWSNPFAWCGGGLFGLRFGSTNVGYSSGPYDMGLDVMDGGVIVGSEGGEIIMEGDGDKEATPREPTPAKRPEARLRRTAPQSVPASSFSGRRLSPPRTATRVMPRHTTQSARL